MLTQRSSIQWIIKANCGLFTAHSHYWEIPRIKFEKAILCIVHVACVSRLYASVQSIKKYLAVYMNEV